MLALLFFHVFFSCFLVFVLSSFFSSSLFLFFFFRVYMNCPGCVPGVIWLKVIQDGTPQLVINIKGNAICNTGVALS